MFDLLDLFAAFVALTGLLILALGIAAIRGLRPSRRARAKGEPRGCGPATAVALLTFPAGLLLLLLALGMARFEGR